MAWQVRKFVLLTGPSMIAFCTFYIQIDMTGTYLLTGMYLAVQSSPKVSVLLSVYNGQRFLRQSIESILNQTFLDFEFIIVDDGSSDDSVKIIESYHDPRVVFLRHLSNQGLVTSLNDGLSIASGQLIARQDADDISLPNRLEEQIKYFDQNPQLVIAGSAGYLIDDTGKHVGKFSVPSSDAEIRWTLLLANSFAHPTVMIRANTLHDHNLRYNSRMQHAEDYDLWSRLLAYGQGKNIEKPLIQYRCHAQQISNIYSKKQKTIAAVIALTNLQRIGVSIPIYEVNMLCSWFSRPRLLTKEQRDVCLKIFEILNMFEKRESIELTQIAIIRKKIVERIFRRITWKELLQIGTIQLLGLWLCKYRARVFAHFVKNLTQKKVGVCLE